MFRTKLLTIGVLATALVVGALTERQASAIAGCCIGPPTSLSDELRDCQVAVLCRLLNRTDVPANDPREGQCTFEAFAVLQGTGHLAAQRQVDGKIILTMLSFGERPLGTNFVAFGFVDAEGLVWSSPTPLTDRGVDYVSRLPLLFDTGSGRLAFFWKHLNAGGQDPVVEGDCFIELNRAPYAELKQLKPHFDHELIVRRIMDPKVETSRRRLYLRALGICGKSDDVAVLEVLIRDKDREMRHSLDTVLGAYLTLRGAEGLPLVEELFLKNPASEYSDTYAAILALRFMRDEGRTIPRDRLTEGMRHILSRPNIADLIVPDLIKAEDWTVVDRLVTLFKESVKESDEHQPWVRLPVINYLRACPLPEAKRHLEELAKLDPETMQRAERYFPNLPKAAP